MIERPEEINTAAWIEYADALEFKIATSKKASIKMSGDLGEAFRRVAELEAENKELRRALEVVKESAFKANKKLMDEINQHKEIITSERG